MHTIESLVGNIYRPRLYKEWRNPLDYSSLFVVVGSYSAEPYRVLPPIARLIDDKGRTVELSVQYSFAPDNQKMGIKFWIDTKSIEGFDELNHLGHSGSWWWFEDLFQEVVKCPIY